MVTAQRWLCAPSKSCKILLRSLWPQPIPFVVAHDLPLPQRKRRFGEAGQGQMHQIQPKALSLLCPGQRSTGLSSLCCKFPSDGSPSKTETTQLQLQLKTHLLVQLQLKTRHLLSKLILAALQLFFSSNLFKLFGHRFRRLRSSFFGRQHLHVVRVTV